MSRELDLDDVAAQSPLAQQELAALRRDAERYRRLRSNSVDEWNMLGHYTLDALDAAIDAAMTKD